MIKIKLDDSHVIINDNSKSKKIILEKAAEIFYQSSGIPKDVIFQKLYEREKLGSTSVGKGVAIPHARIENIDEIFSIGLNRAITLIAEAKPGRMSSSIIKDLGEHPEDKKPVRIMKGQYGPYIKYKSLNATIPEEKDPAELTMEEALILIEKRKEYDKNKKSKKRKSKWVMKKT